MSRVVRRVGRRWFSSPAVVPSSEEAYEIESQRRRDKQYAALCKAGASLLVERSDRELIARVKDVRPAIPEKPQMLDLLRTSATIQHLTQQYSFNIFKCNSLLRPRPFQPPPTLASAHAIVDLKAIAFMPLKSLKQLLDIFHKLGLSRSDISDLIDESPKILLKSDKEILSTLSYFSTRGFTRRHLCRILMNYPSILLMQIEEIDNRLLKIRKSFLLKDVQLREMFVNNSRIASKTMESVEGFQLQLISVGGFEPPQVRTLVVRSASLLLEPVPLIMERIDYLLKFANLDHGQIEMMPELLTIPLATLKSRHEALAFHARDQYDPERPRFVNLLNACLAESEAEFASEYLGISYNDYLLYLKRDSAE